MKIINAVILSVLLLLFAACGQKVNDPADVAAVKNSIADYAKAVNAGDADGIAALMTDKTIYAMDNLPVAVGKEAIKSLEAGALSLFKTEFSCPVEDVRVVGDLAVARGSWTLNMTPKAEGIAPAHGSGSWITTFVRQSDGSWKFDWCVPNSNQPAPGSTANGEDENALYQLERDWAIAYAKKDAATVEKFLADEYVSNSEGRIQNKKQTLAEMKNNPAKIESAVNSDMKAMVFGDMAVIHGMATEKSTTNGKDTSRQWRYTELYVKRDGRWQCVTGYSPKVQ